MEGVSLGNFNKLKSSTIPMAQFSSCLFYESDQDDRTTAKNLRIIFQLLLTKGFIATFLTIMWDHMNGFAKQYCCASDIYLLTCFALEFIIIVDRLVGSPGHGKDVVDDMNDR